jgi:hypothetical protein
MPGTIPSVSRWLSGLRANFAKTLHELLKWSKDLNLGLQKEHWRGVLDRQPEPKDKRLILLQNGTPIEASRRPGITVSQDSFMGPSKSPTISIHLPISSDIHT